MCASRQPFARVPDHSCRIRTPVDQVTKKNNMRFTAFFRGMFRDAVFETAQAIITAMNVADKVMESRHPHIYRGSGQAAC